MFSLKAVMTQKNISTIEMRVHFDEGDSEIYDVFRKNKQGGSLVDLVSPAEHLFLRSKCSEIAMTHSFDYDVYFCIIRFEVDDQGLVSGLSEYFVHDDPVVINAGSTADAIESHQEVSRLIRSYAIKQEVIDLIFGEAVELPAKANNTQQSFTDSYLEDYLRQAVPRQPISYSQSTNNIILE